jgi:predicted N-acetyltransferase YhbS
VVAVDVGDCRGVIVLIETGPARDFDAGEIVAGLNEAFGSWGDRRLFDWAFTRPGAGLLPDMLVVREEGRLIASSAVTYRRAVSEAGLEGIAAIIGGSWTAAKARGRGIFGELLRRSIELARGRGVAVVIGMGREDNLSRRAFDTAGAQFQQAAYCRSTGAVIPVEPLDLLTPDPTRFLPRASHSHFAYADDEWREQFIERPGPVECVGREGEWIALVERSSAFDRLIALSAASSESWRRAVAMLAASAHDRERRLFVYTSIAEERDWLAGNGFEVTAGFIPMIPPGEFTGWHFQNGDRG